MIIFDLDGTLADCEHRRHFVKPYKYPNLCEYSNYRIIDEKAFIDLDGRASWRYKKTGEPFQDGWKSFCEACDKDLPIRSSLDILEYIAEGKEYGSDTPWIDFDGIQIWSGRCESVRNKTETWLKKNLRYYYPDILTIKMRPIGNTEPDEVLKERWLDEAIAEGKTIDFVFDANPKSIQMWRRRGIFVFNCCQHDEEF